MILPDDILAFLDSHYPDTQRRRAVLLLESARLEDGGMPAPRLLRCAAFASEGCVERLERLVALLGLDWRDVVMAGEYELRGAATVQVRDLGQPFAP